MFENRLHLFAVATPVLFLNERFMRLQDGKQLFVSGIVDKDAPSVGAGDGKALFVVSSLPTERTYW